MAQATTHAAPASAAWASSESSTSAPLVLSHYRLHGLVRPCRRPARSSPRCDPVLPRRLHLATKQPDSAAAACHEASCFMPQRRLQFASVLTHVYATCEPGHDPHERVGAAVSAVSGRCLRTYCCLSTRTQLGSTEPGKASFSRVTHTEQPWLGGFHLRYSWPAGHGSPSSSCVWWGSCSCGSLQPTSYHTGLGGSRHGRALHPERCAGLRLSTPPAWH